MSRASERFRSVLSRPTCTLAANIFDPLSARIAEILEYEVCKLSGTVGKTADLAAPDIVVSNMSDLVDRCRRITRVADVSLMVDADDCGGNPVNVWRTVRELEAAGVCAIEIEDDVLPTEFDVESGLGAGEETRQSWMLPQAVSTEEQVARLEAAVAARTDPTTVIIARTSALIRSPLDEALDRISAYSQTGAEALVFNGGFRHPEDLVAVHKVTPLPLFVIVPFYSDPIPETKDPEFLAANGVRILMIGNPAFWKAVQAIYDSLKHLKDGGSLDDLGDPVPTHDLVQQVNRTDQFKEWQRKYARN